MPKKTRLKSKIAPPQTYHCYGGEQSMLQTLDALKKGSYIEVERRKCKFRAMRYAKHLSISNKYYLTRDSCVILAKEATGTSKH